MPQISPLRLTGAQCLMDGQMMGEALTITHGLIGDGPAREVDLTGYLLLPAIIDLHGDGFERHLSPRPTAPFDKRRALTSVATELAANGITTAWLAQSWSWEGGFRSGAATLDLLAALQDRRASLLADCRVQIRLETHIPQEFAKVLQAVRTYGVDYVVFNNHLPEALDMAKNQPKRFANWAAQTKRTAEDMLQIVQAADAAGPQVPSALADLAAQFAALGLRMGSHDDASPQTRTFFRSIGARNCEFPTTLAAAQAARDSGEPVLMGAPNVVRGGSQSGNIAAQSLIEAGLCDALVSDYYYPALAQAAFHLMDAGVMDLPAAWAMISTHPAQIAGLQDRGALTVGKRADLVAVNAETRAVEMTLSAGRIAHLSGEAARRVWSAAMIGG